jgi:hypothetical protein
MGKALTIAILDAADSGNTATAFRIAAAALGKGMDVHIFACEAPGERPRASVADLAALAKEKGATFEWASGAPGLAEGGAGRLYERVRSSVNTLVIPKR